jgi:phosphoribosylformylglycinamidine synthase PurS subunit
MKARVTVMLKSGVLDPQGEAIRHALGSLGFQGVNGVRQGKVIELDLAATDAAAAETEVKAMCEKLLANTVIGPHRQMRHRHRVLARHALKAEGADQQRQQQRPLDHGKARPGADPGAGRKRHVGQARRGRPSSVCQRSGSKASGLSQSRSWRCRCQGDSTSLRAGGDGAVAQLSGQRFRAPSSARAGKAAAPRGRRRG